MGTDSAPYMNMYIQKNCHTHKHFQTTMHISNQNPAHQRLRRQFILTHTHISILRPLLSLLVHALSPSLLHLLSGVILFSSSEPLSDSTLALPLIPFVSDMSNTQLRAHQQLPDSITLMKTKRGPNLLCTQVTVLSFPRPLAYYQ